MPPGGPAPGDSGQGSLRRLQAAAAPAPCPSASSSKSARPSAGSLRPISVQRPTALAAAQHYMSSAGGGGSLAAVGMAPNHPTAAASAPMRTHEQAQLLSQLDSHIQQILGTSRAANAPPVLGVPNQDELVTQDLMRRAQALLALQAVQQQPATQAPASGPPRATLAPRSASAKRQASPAHSSPARGASAYIKGAAQQVRPGRSRCVLPIRTFACIASIDCHAMKRFYNAKLLLKKANGYFSSRHTVTCRHLVLENTPPQP